MKASQMVFGVAPLIIAAQHGHREVVGFLGRA